MPQPSLTTSSRYPTRIIGIIYLLYFLIAILAEVFNKGMLVPGNAAGTANNMLAHQTQYQFGFATGLVGTAFYIVLAALFYELFKPVNRTISLVAAFISLAGGIVQAVGSLFRLAPLVVLGGSPYLNTFKKEQLQTLALLFLALRGQSTNIELVFFGFYDVMLATSSSNQSSYHVYWVGS